MAIYLSIDDDNDGYGWTVASESQNPQFDLAHSGVYGAIVQYNSSGNDDWLITPAINLTNVNSANFSFWARSHSATYLEDFNVKLSTSGTSIGNFTTTIGSETNISDQWQQYSYNLNSYTGNTIYLAVQCVSVDDYYLFADDFLVEASASIDDGFILNIHDAYISQNYPNPFNPTTKIRYNLPKNVTDGSIEIFNIKGALICEIKIVDDNNYVIWNGKDNYPTFRISKKNQLYERV
ncbi:MAG: choice-of-anchor J domain-containing protein [Candidatus Cloacimonetes bacterium]|nr:choice-of-anchor J domain-containing protein [Candidatus Cloacimonadota bacterium]